ncbi:MAG: transporter substrate-binding domain-containing protein [Zavarzinia sp.]|nr:transporter substrate-binding domain-containing protein [Zavarzinia sp.]
MNIRIAAFALAAGLATTGPLHAAEVPAFAAKGKAVFCMDATFPPMEFFETSGDKEPTGFDVDLVKAIAGNWGVTPEIVSMDFAGLLPSLEAGRCDAVVSGMFVTPARTEKFDAVPYLATSSVLIAKDGTAALASMDELAGKTVAVQTGTEFVKWFEKINADLKAKGLAAVDVQLYPKASDGIQQVMLGRAFATTTQDTEVAYRTLQAPGTLTTVHVFEDTQTFGIYLRREGEDAKMVTATVAALKESGALGEIVAKWRLSATQLDVSK